MVVILFGTPCTRSCMLNRGCECVDLHEWSCRALEQNFMKYFITYLYAKELNWALVYKRVISHQRLDHSKSQGKYLYFRFVHISNYWHAQNASSSFSITQHRSS